MTKTLVLGISLLAAAACSSSVHSPAASTSDQVATSVTVATSTGSDTSAGVTPGGGGGASDALGPVSPDFGIFIEGVNNTTLTSAVLAIRSVSAEVGGVPVPVDTTYMQVPDLAVPCSWRVGSMKQLAAGTTALITVTFDVDGSWASTNGSGAVLGWTTPLEFRAVAEGTALRDHVVLKVDVDRSFLAGCAWKKVGDDGCSAAPSCTDQVAFLPDFGVYY